MTDQPTKPSESQSISRAVAVLRAVAERPGASLGEIAKATGLARATVQRLVGALNGEGLLARSFGQQGVYLGMELARLASKVALDARLLFRPAMAELHATVGENIDLTVLEQGRVIVIEQFASNETIQVISHVGQQHPIHCTANGKAHLGQVTRTEALALLGDDLPRYTSNTITDPDALMSQVAAFQGSGIYVDQEEFGSDICAIATTLPAVGGRKLAISLAMPASRFRRREDELKAILLKFRNTIQSSFGNSI